MQIQISIAESWGNTNVMKIDLTSYITIAIVYVSYCNATQVLQHYQSQDNTCYIKTTNIKSIKKHVFTVLRKITVDMTLELPFLSFYVFWDIFCNEVKVQ